MTLTTALRKSRYMQYVSTTIATLSTASAGMYLSWSSPTLPQLTSPNSPIGVQISGEEGSWVASSVLLGSTLACIVSGWIVDKIGSKTSLLMCAVPLTIPWIAIVFVKSALGICIVRFIAGLGWGVIMTAVSMYNGEIAENDIRGKLGTSFNILKLIGSLYVLSVGPFVSYTALALSCAVLPVVSAVLIFFVPESPYYLIKMGRTEAARRSIVKLSSKSVNSSFIDSRVKEIQTTVDCDMRNQSTLREMLTHPEYRKPVIVMTGIQTLQLMSGYPAIEAYMQTIIEASDSNISSDVFSIIAGVIQILAGCRFRTAESVIVVLCELSIFFSFYNNFIALMCSYLRNRAQPVKIGNEIFTLGTMIAVVVCPALPAAFLVDKMGRKPLMIISSLGCALALIGEGVYFYLRDVAGTEVSNISWLPATALLLYFVMIPLGLFTLPWILLGELFATNIKGIAISFFSFYGGVLAFLVTKFFNPVSEALGIHITFWIFAGACILGAIFCYFVQPETKGKSFAEIQKEMRDGIGAKHRNRV